MPPPPPPSYWLRIMDGLCITDARHGEAGTRERVRHAPCPSIRQLGPRYEGQLTWMVEPICHSFCSLVRSHDYHHLGLRTDGQGRTERVIERGRCLRTILRAVCGGGGGACRGPRTTTSFGPQRELPPARLLIHRTDLCQHNIGNAGRCSRGRASVLLLPATLTADKGRAPHYQRAPREGYCWGGGATPLSAEFRARNHSVLEHIDLVVGHGHSGVPLSSTRLHQ